MSQHKKSPSVEPTVDGGAVVRKPWQSPAIEDVAIVPVTLAKSPGTPETPTYNTVGPS